MFDIFPRLSLKSLKIVIMSLVLGIASLIFAFGFMAGRCHGAEIALASASPQDAYAAGYAEWCYGTKPLVIEYSATWCAPCRQAAVEVLPALAAKYTVIRLDVDRDQAIIKRYGLPLPASLPCCYVYPPHHRRYVPHWHDQGHANGPWFFLGVPGLRLLLK